MLSITDVTSVTDSESEMPVKDFILLVVYLHSVYPSPFCLGEGWTSYQIFKKGGGFTGPQLLEEGDFFQGWGSNIYIKDKIRYCWKIRCG